MKSVAAVGAGPLILPLTCLLVLSTLCLKTPLNHDEGQYVAAAQLVRSHLLPYRDFPYLQTPLQPLLYSLLAWATPGWAFLALRLANAVCVTAAIIFIGRTTTALCKDERAGVLSMLLALTADPVLFAGSVARNDALPLLFLSGALVQLFPRGHQPGALRAALAGLLLAAAALTKISYALPAAAVCAQALWRARVASFRRPALALLAGALAGASLGVPFALLAPRAALFQVYTYNAVAPHAWAAVKGQLWRFTFPVRAAEWTVGMLQGPLLALAVAGVSFRRRSVSAPADAPRLIALGPVVAAAALATILPSPSLRQYLIPLAAPLIPWAVRILWPLRFKFRGPSTVLALTLLIALGLTRSALCIVAAGGGYPAIRAEQGAHHLGQILRRAGRMRVATLEPVQVVDSGLDLDPRFATGQFLFRASNVAECADASLCPITNVSLDRLNAAPPDAIVTGTQRKQPAGVPGGLDGLLDRWAAQHRYSAIALSKTDLLWTAPSATLRATAGEPKR